MKRTVLLILLAVVFCAIISAADVSATGYGRNPEEAKADALTNIFYKVFNATVSSYTKTVTSADNNKNTSNSYSNQSIVSVEGKLIGIEYSDAEKTSKTEKKSGAYKVTATVPDSMAAGYSKLQKDAVANINILFSRKTDLETNSSTDFAARKNNLSELSNALKEYQLYSNALIALGHSDMITDHNHMNEITYESSQIELMSLLTEEQNMLSKELDEASDETTKSNVQNLLTEAKKELVAMQQERDESIQAQSEAINQRIQNIVNTAVFNMTPLEISDNAKSEDLKDQIKVLKDSINSYEKLLDNMINILTTESRKIINEKNISINAIRNKAYKSGEMSGGKPTEIALAFRQQEIDELEAEKQSALMSIAEIVWEQMGNEIRVRYSKCQELLNEFRNRSYTVSLRNKEISVSVLNYDGNKGEWSIRVYFKDIDMGSFILPYETVSGEKPFTSQSNIKDRESYYAYINLQDKLNTQLKTGFSAVGDLILEFKVSDVMSDRLIITTKQCSYVSNMNNKRTVLTPSEKPDNVQYFLNTELLDHGYSWITESSAGVPSNLFSSLGINTAPVAQKTLQQEQKEIQTKQKEIQTKQIMKSFSPNSMLSWVFAPKTTVSFGSVSYNDEKTSDMSVSMGADIGKFFLNHIYLGVTPAVYIRRIGNTETMITRFGLLGDIGFQYSRFMAGIRGGYGGKLFIAQVYGKVTLPQAYITSVSFDPTVEIGLELEGNPFASRFYTGVSIIF